VKIENRVRTILEKLQLLTVHVWRSIKCRRSGWSWQIPRR